MNKKPYIIIAVSVFIITLGVVVTNSYIHRSAKPELNTSSNRIENPAGIDKSKITSKTVEDKLIKGELRDEDGKGIKGTLPFN